MSLSPKIKNPGQRQRNGRRNREQGYQHKKTYDAEQAGTAKKQTDNGGDGQSEGDGRHRTSKFSGVLMREADGQGRYWVGIAPTRTTEDSGTQ